MKGPKKTPHTACHPGKRVLVVLMDGETFIDKFRDRTNSDVRFDDRGWISKARIKSFTIYKPRPGVVHIGQGHRVI